MLLIYTQKTTPRIIYAFRHICTNLLDIPVKFTSKIEEFIAHENEKLSYGKQALGNELFIQNVDLLLEQGISEVDINVQPWEDSFCFFEVTGNSALPFDIFAASFYLLSRYEEYLPHVKDDGERFPATESLAFKEGFLQSPVVDIWAYKFRDVLIDRFPNLQPATRDFSSEAIFAVEHIFNYKNKGFIRSLAGIFNDFFRLNFGKILDRFQVLLGLQRDPFDIFEDIINFIKKHHCDPLFMFQLSDFTVHDRNINPNRIPHQTIIKFVADYARVGLLQGYYSLSDIRILRKEKLRMENIIHAPLQHIINMRHPLELPENYSHINELEIQNDYSMGYPGTFGFRAGTCSPFLFYDISLEVTTPLRIHPYVFHSAALNPQEPEKMRSQVGKVLSEVKKVDGSLLAVFKNQDFSRYYPRKFYYSILKQIYEVQ